MSAGGGARDRGRGRVWGLDGSMHGAWMGVCLPGPQGRGTGRRRPPCRSRAAAVAGARARHRDGRRSPGLPFARKSALNLKRGPTAERTPVRSTQARALLGNVATKEQEETRSAWAQVEDCNRAAVPQRPVVSDPTVMVSTTSTACTGPGSGGRAGSATLLPLVSREPRGVSVGADAALSARASL